MKRNIKSFIMFFAALFIYSVAGAQTVQKMEEKKEMKDTVIVDGKLVEVGYKIIADGVTDGFTKIEKRCCQRLQVN